MPRSEKKECSETENLLLFLPLICFCYINKAGNYEIIIAHRLMESSLSCLLWNIYYINGF